jgi:hypothetical protein
MEFVVFLAGKYLHDLTAVGSKPLYVPPRHIRWHKTSVTLGSQQNRSRSGERLPQPRDHHEVGVERHAGFAVAAATRERDIAKPS